MNERKADFERACRPKRLLFPILTVKNLHNKVSWHARAACA
jgi:hypothetical protein